MYLYFFLAPLVTVAVASVTKGVRMWDKDNLCGRLVGNMPL